MNREPKTADSDVRTGLYCRQLLAVSEDAGADGDQRDVEGIRVGDGEGEDVLGVNHEANIGNFTAPVNGYFTGCGEKEVRSFYRAMDLAQILERIEDRLKVVKLSADAASNAAGKKDAIRNMKRAVKEGRKGVSTKTLLALAPVLRVSPGWLIDGSDENPSPNLNHKEPLPVESAQIPILGIVEAGAWREIIPEEEMHPEVLQVAKDRRFPDAKHFLLRVRGDSMNLATPQPFIDGALARCITWADTGMRLRTGLIIVVRRWNGAIAETTLKRVHEFPEQYELRPESSNPAHQSIFIPRDRDDHAEHIDVIALVTGVTYEFDL